MLKLSARSEIWPLRVPFGISRGAKSSAHVVVVELRKNAKVGLGEAVPYARYQQTVEQTLDEIHDIKPEIENGLSREELQARLVPGATRNALDCALWDLQAKLNHTRVWKLAGVPKPVPVSSLFTLGLNTPANMASVAEKAVKHHSFLKLKLGIDKIVESVQAVRKAAPTARLTVDANEAWNMEVLQQCLPALSQLGVKFIEQPLPAVQDHQLENFNSEIPICADESFHTQADLKKLLNRYQIFNVKLDKTGGLTEAIELIRKIEQHGKKIMIGSMMATSLALAPAMLLTYNAQFVDLDSSEWLERDRVGGIQFVDGKIRAPKKSFWG